MSHAFTGPSRMVDKRIGLKDIVHKVVGHRGKGMSPLPDHCTGGYFHNKDCLHYQRQECGCEIVLR